MRPKRKDPVGRQPGRAIKSPKAASQKTVKGITQPADVLKFPGADKPKVYLAGKIDGPPWRAEIAPAPRCEENRCDASYADEHEALDRKFMLEFPQFVMTGPFAIDDGHSSSWPASHGGPARVGEPEAARQARIFALSMRRIGMADFMFAHINELDAFGTIVEIGAAHAIGKPIFLHFGERLTDADLAEMWFIGASATAVTWAREITLKDAFDAALRSWRGSAVLAASI